MLANGTALIRLCSDGDAEPLKVNQERLSKCHPAIPEGQVRPDGTVDRVCSLLVSSCRDKSNHSTVGRRRRAQSVSYAWLHSLCSQNWSEFVWRCTRIGAQSNTDCFGDLRVANTYGTPCKPISFVQSIGHFRNSLSEIQITPSILLGAQSNNSFSAAKTFSSSKMSDKDSGGGEKLPRFPPEMTMKEVANEINVEG